MTENRSEVETTAYKDEKNRDINRVLGQSNFSRFNEERRFMNENRTAQLKKIREKVQNIDKEF